jgi:hypothetical protein
MNKVLIGFCRAGTWLTVALSGLNAGILLLDGLVHSGQLPTRYLIVTAAAGLVFGAIGVAIFGLHWSLDRIRSHPTGSVDRTAMAGLAMPWMVVHLVLGVILAISAAVMASAAIAMIGRLRQGFTIFG